MDREFISPIVSDESLPYILLDGQTLWQEQILDAIHSIYECRESTFAPLHIQSLFYQIWGLMSENVQNVRRKTGFNDRRLYILKDMLSFIQDNYSSKVTLNDIAAAGNVSSSTCLVIFSADCIHQYYFSFSYTSSVTASSHSLELVSPAHQRHGNYISKTKTDAANPF